MHRRSKFTHGDFQKIVTTEVRKMLSQIVVAKQDFPRPYYVLGIVNKRYDGPAAVKSIDKDGQVVAPVTKDIDVAGKKIIPTRFVIMGQPPILPQLGTILFRVDNKRGKVEIMYSLPPDLPNHAEDSDNFGAVSKLAAESIRRLGVPLCFN